MDEDLISALGGFGAHPGHDAHILSTLSAIQILVTQDALDVLDVDRTVRCTSYKPHLISSLTSSPDIASLQQPSGVFAGDSFGEIDTRFSYIALNALSLLGRIDAIDKEKAAEYISKCKNFDGGFGRIIGSESHSGQCLSNSWANVLLD